MVSRRVKGIAAITGVVIAVGVGASVVAWMPADHTHNSGNRGNGYAAVVPPVSPLSSAGAHAVASSGTAGAQPPPSVASIPAPSRFTVPSSPASPPALGDFDTLDTEGQADQIEAIAALTHVDGDLRQALITILAQRGHDAYVRNQIANLLSRHDADPTDLVPALIAAITDDQELPLWRDYALQHLGNVTPRGGDEAIQAQAIATVQDCFHGDVLTLPGTALIALLAWQDSGFRPLLPADIERAHTLAASATADTDSRITAIAALADHDLPDARLRLRELLAGETEPILLATIAAALGRCGTSDDSSLLARFADHDSALVSGHATAAMQRLANIPSLSTPSSEVTP